MTALPGGKPPTEPLAEVGLFSARFPLGAGFVVTVSWLDGFELLPAASLARTVNPYAVAGLRPVTVKLVAAVVAMTVPDWRTSYPVTPTLSVEADHASETLFEVLAGLVRFAGTLGGWVSTGPPVVAVHTCSSDT